MLAMRLSQKQALRAKENFTSIRMIQRWHSISSLKEPNIREVHSYSDQSIGCAGRWFHVLPPPSFVRQVAAWPDTAFVGCSIGRKTGAKL